MKRGSDGAEMNDDFRSQIHNELNLKETDDLLILWQGNNRVEWSDVAFEIIKEILEERGIEIPQQDEPIYEYNEDNVERHDFSSEELKIIDDENSPEFYDPLEVLKFSKWINLVAKWMVLLIFVQG